MMVSMRYIVILCYVFSAFGYVFSSYNTNTFLYDLRSQCPLRISFPPPLLVETDGESLDKALGSSQKDDVTAILFYASWCPFSTDVKSKFGALNSMFPRIRHVMVEQSKAMPSVFSRYGVHSFPAILIVNQTTRVWYHGRKDLQSLVNFYKRTTGLDPVIEVTEHQITYKADGHKAFQQWKGSSLRELLLSEPYLVLSVAFLLFRASLYFFPGLVAHVVALWVAYIPHLNMGIFGESRQLLGRVFHVIDLKRAWSKLKLSKTRNFHKGARNARVWASSLASVSLGETSSARVSSSGDS
ncbi:5'-adenylylsulfate reductase-like 5 [Nicotiana tabacum]|uniref:5'-adenylylsulfate reductase-like 5 n=2 Tax=Nicotiana TaxID=4085 RepID=A0A1S4BD18_TOBAC|nr:PREDICTED: 5'-adenylylsulfate reductase-like 5 [Nicotiana sylvestris]XP_016486728.1 PREDICTED: 5'-adenylylsulfate reductase-like 5 [Nicotiana tabacum]